MKMLFGFVPLPLALLLATVPMSLAIPQNPVAAGNTGKDPVRVLEHDPDSTSSGALPKLRLEFRNPGPDDLVLNIGTMLANGKKQYPEAIILVITDSRGTFHEMGFAGGPWAIGGRVDPFVLPLPAGATFSLPVDLEKASAADGSKYRFDGSYTIEARFIGKAVISATTRSSLQDGVLMPFWTGRVTSNRLHFEVATH